MTTVLVTGGAGRLGRSVVAGLADHGYQVVSVDRSTVPDAPATQVIADLTDAGAAYSTMARFRPEVVLHLAAIAVPFSAPEQNILATNSSLVFNTVQAAVDSGARTVITASSPTVLGYGAPAGWVPDRLPLDELTPPRPWNAYAMSKLIAEQTVQAFAAKVGESVRFASFRPCFVISPEEWGGAPTQTGHTVRERLDDPSLSAPALFNYVDARDVADFLVALIGGADRIPNASTFFVGAADALARESLSELVPRYHPGTSGVAAGLTDSAPAFSVQRAADLLGWTPKRSWRTELAH